MDEVRRKRPDLRRGRPKTQGMRESSRRWYAKNKDRLKAKALAYHRDNPHVAHAAKQVRRARARGAFVERVYRTVVLLLAGGLCGICGLAVDPKNFHVDHRIALAAGGDHSYANTQPAHPTCNLRKGSRA